MKRRAAFAVLLVAAGLIDVARSGHEFPVYPSYYPHEIRIETMAPDRAAGLLLEGKIQAYIGPEPRFANAPDSILAVESLGSLVIVRLNPESSRAPDHAAACVLARTVIREIARRHGQFRFHPYPVTPYDGDYLYHTDLADAARIRFIGTAAGAGATTARGPRVRTSSVLAKSLVPADWNTQGSAWDVDIDEVSAADLAAASTMVTNGWIAPPWARSGWSRAARLLAPSVDDPRQQVRVNADLDRLESGAFADTVERIKLERELVSELASGCRAVVAGYTVKREYISADYSAGIENIAFDSIAGFNSPMFVRTVKLKDFPWNGWLSLGMDSRPAAAWNPIAGFSDPFGRQMWNAIGDPALLPSPNDAGWVLNRISDVR